MSHIAAVSKPVTALPQMRRLVPRSRLSRRRVEALLYDAVAEALGLADVAKPARPSVAAATRQLETA